ncbi:MAG: nucleotide pyrophosphohydrolase [Candidatus Kerfeldbacteria bacterium]|nr:nucleotide pyrophosphohydrolase [Candidatus Kerfeldbacteria bacterium]
MTIKSVQQAVDDWVKQYREGYWPPHVQLARLIEEVGELAREINHRYGPKKKKINETEAELADELADIVFTVVAMANSMGIDLDKAFGRVMAKYYGRDQNRWEKK